MICSGPKLGGLHEYFILTLDTVKCIFKHEHMFRSFKKLPIPVWTGIKRIVTIEVLVWDLMLFHPYHQGHFHA